MFLLIEVSLNAPLPRVQGRRGLYRPQVHEHPGFLLHRNVQRLVLKAHRLCVSLNSRLESNKEERRGLCRSRVHARRR